MIKFVLAGLKEMGFSEDAGIHHTGAPYEMRYRKMRPLQCRLQICLQRWPCIPFRSSWTSFRMSIDTGIGLDTQEGWKNAGYGKRIFLSVKNTRVPADLTIMTAMEYAGYTLKRGCGCRHGFCGACATIYRIKGENELKTCLACQTQVQEGMYVASIPVLPHRQENLQYRRSETQPAGDDGTLSGDLQLHRL